MFSVQGPVIFAAVCAKQARVHDVSVRGVFVSSKVNGSGLFEFKGVVELKNKVKVVSTPSYVRRKYITRCSLSSSSGGQGRTDNFYGSSDDYVESSIVEAGMMSWLVFLSAS